MSSLDYTFGWVVAAWCCGYVVHGGRSEPLGERLLRAVLMGAVAFLAVVCVHIFLSA